MTKVKAGSEDWLGEELSMLLGSQLGYIPLLACRSQDEDATEFAMFINDVYEVR